MPAELGQQLSNVNKKLDPLVKGQDVTHGKLDRVIALNELHAQYLASIRDQQDAGFKAMIAGQQLAAKHMDHHGKLLERIARSLEGKRRES